MTHRGLMVNLGIFLGASFYGWCQELLLGHWNQNILFIERNKCGDKFITKVLRLCLPLLNVYGFGALITFNIFMETREYLPIPLIIVICTLLAIILECITAILMFKIFGSKSWDYDTPWCYGGISIQHSFMWLLLVTIAILSLNKFIPASS